MEPHGDDKQIKSSDKIIDQQFLTRAQKIERMEFPMTSPESVILLPNNEALGYRYGCYSQYLNGKLSQSEFNVYVRQFNKIIMNIWEARRRQEQEEYGSNLQRLLYLAIFISLIAIILLISLVYGDNSNLNLLYAAIILIISAAFIISTIVFISWWTNPTFIDLVPTVMKELNNYINLENQKLINRGLQWSIGDQFYYVELLIAK